MGRIHRQQSGQRDIELAGRGLLVRWGFINSKSDAQAFHVEENYSGARHISATGVRQSGGLRF
jgi:hypothetical protein